MRNSSEISRKLDYFVSLAVLQLQSAATDFSTYISFKNYYSLIYCLYIFVSGYSAKTRRISKALMILSLVLQVILFIQYNFMNFVMCFILLFMNIKLITFFFKFQFELLPIQFSLIMLSDQRGFTICIFSITCKGSCS